MRRLRTFGVSVVLVHRFGTLGVALGTALPLLVSMLVLQPQYVCRAVGLEYGTYYREIGRAAFLAILYQVPLFVCVYGLQLSSLLLVFAIAAIYYPPCLLFLLPPYPCPLRTVPAGSRRSGPPLARVVAEIYKIENTALMPWFSRLNSHLSRLFMRS